MVVQRQMNKSDRLASWVKFQPSYFLLFVITANCRKRATKESERDRCTKNVYMRGIYRDGPPIERTVKTELATGSLYARIGRNISRRDVTSGDMCRAVAARVKINSTQDILGRRTMAMARSRAVDPSRHTALFPVMPDVESYTYMTRRETMDDIILTDLASRRDARERLETND